ncbi:MAG: acyltransferase, partial [Caulobacterales bacterium]
EWFAYVTFPAFAFVAVKFWDRPRLAVASALAAMIPLYIGFQAITGELLTEATIRWGALRIVPCFALGCSLWLLWRSGAVTTQRTALIILSAALLLLVGFTTVGAPDWMTVAACGGIVFGLGALGSSGSKLLTNKTFIYLGEVSYAVYMVCVPWKLVVTEGLNKVLGVNPEAMPIGWWLVLFVGVVPAAMVLHHLVERPARTFMRTHAPRFASKPVAAKPAAGAV